jgi:hypothetical protein
MAAETVLELPPAATITQLKKQAKELRRAARSGDREARRRVARWDRDPAESEWDGLALRDAQFVLAREYGFDGWNQLSAEVGKRMIEQRDLHRWFGVQLNNGMWDAIEDPSVGPDSPVETRERLLYSAYASAYHWIQVGNEANHARGEHLIARMAVKIGEYELGARHARRCLELIEAHPEVMEAWDEPFGHEALARALAGLGDGSAAEKHRATAVELTAALTDAEDRAILEGELAREPWFGLT